MPEKSLFGLAKIPGDRSVIVVSDLHLGGGQDLDTAERFCKFLEYIRSGFTSVPVYCHTCNMPVPDPEKTRWLHPPEKIILLGDFLDLWDPRDQDRNSAFLDALFPFLKLKDLDSDVVYVTGNHDEDVTELIASRDDAERASRERPDEKKISSLWSSRYKLLHSTDEQGRTKAESIKFGWNGLRTFEICRRHYPDDDVEGGEEGLEIGNTRYAFLHGQQFDKEQITTTISEAAGNRFDPVDFLEDLASISASKESGSQVWASQRL